MGTGCPGKVRRRKEGWGQFRCWGAGAWREKRAEQRWAGRQENACLEPWGCLFEAKNSVREKWEAERGRNFGTNLWKALGAFGLFPKGRGRAKGRKVTLKSTSHVPGSEDTKAVW